MIKLSPAERWILSNQYRIIAKLYPDEEKRCDEIREVLEDGYERHYSPEYLVTDPSEIMSAAECEEVLNILQMFLVLGQSWNALEDRSGIDESAVRFGGFDGNNETKQLGYTRWYCSHDGGRFEGDVNPHDLNSHAQRLPRYRAMLVEYNGVKDGKTGVGSTDYLLTREELLRVTSARADRGR